MYLFTVFIFLLVLIFTGSEGLVIRTVFVTPAGQRLNKDLPHRIANFRWPAMSPSSGDNSRVEHPDMFAAHLAAVRNSGGPAPAWEEDRLECTVQQPKEFADKKPICGHCKCQIHSLRQEANMWPLQAPLAFTPKDSFHREGSCPGPRPCAGESERRTHRNSATTEDSGDETPLLKRVSFVSKRSAVEEVADEKKVAFRLLKMRYGNWEPKGRSIEWYIK